MMYWYDHDMNWSGYVGMGIGLLLLLLLVIGGIAALVTFVVRDEPPRPQPSPQSAAEVLAARFARGEIDASEYRDRLSVLHETTRT